MSSQPFTPALNPADETIRVGPLTIRFLLTGAQSTAIKTPGSSV